MQTTELYALVRAAQRGDQRAWTRIIAAWTPMVRGVVRRTGLRTCDIDDAVQLTWLQALTHIGSLTTPEALPGWFATIARRTAFRMMQIGTRELLTDTLVERESDEPPVEHAVSEQERAAAIQAAVDRLPDHQRTLLRALLEEPSGSYEYVAKRLAIPVGSIGPTRARSIARLRKDRELALAVAA